MMVELRSGYEVGVFSDYTRVERLLWHRKEGACSIDEEETLMGKNMGATFLFSWIIIEAFCANIRHLLWNLRENTVEVHVVQGRPILTRKFGPLDTFLAT